MQVYQGDDEDALKNILVGDFRIEGLTPLPGANEILCRMRLDLDGILDVTAVEKRTGKSKQITIANALQAKSDEEIAEARKRLHEMFASRERFGEEPDDFEADESENDKGTPLTIDADPMRAVLPGEEEAVALMERSRGILDRMHAEDREEAIDLHEKLEAAIDAGNVTALAEASRALRELLFFMEGRPN